MEGRSYKEISAILDVSETALESLIFRARRSLAEELENLVTCDRAELALSQQTDGRLGRKERKRLVAHLAECPSCARVATLGLKRRRAFKGLALLPLPFSLTFFKGAPSASAAIGLPTIGGSAAAGTAAGVGIGGVTAKIAIGLAAVAVAGGAGYEGVQTVRKPATPTGPTRATPAAVVPAVAQPAMVRVEPGVARATPAVVTRKTRRKKHEARQEAAPRETGARNGAGEGAQCNRTGTHEGRVGAERQERSSARRRSRAEPKARAQRPRQDATPPREDVPQRSRRRARRRSRSPRSSRRPSRVDVETKSKNPH